MKQTKNNVAKRLEDETPVKLAKTTKEELMYYLSPVYSEKQLMATINLDDIVVVASEDVIMISDKKNCKDVGLIVEKLKTQKRLEWREVVNQKKRIVKSLEN